MVKIVSIIDPHSKTVILAVMGIIKTRIDSKKCKSFSKHIPMFLYYILSLTTNAKTAQKILFLYKKMRKINWKIERSRRVKESKQEMALLLIYIHFMPTSGFDSEQNVFKKVLFQRENSQLIIPINILLKERKRWRKKILMRGILQRNKKKLTSIIYYAIKVIMSLTEFFG